MSDTELSSAGLDARRRRVLYRARHRGMREMDILIGGFADHALAGLTDAELDAFEALLELPDQEALGWLLEDRTPPAPYDTGLWSRLKAFHHKTRPVYR